MQPSRRHYNSPRTESVLSCLDSYLRVQNASEVKRWCRQQGLGYSMPARLAFAICRKECLDARNSRHRNRATCITRIPRPWDSEDAWRELVEWRHSRLDLNLLQLAIVLKSDQNFIEYLWHPTFLREENYPDESGRLVNHPFHLMLALGHWTELIHRNFLSLEDIRVELLLEERTIDLTAARLQRSPSKNKYQQFFASLFKGLFSRDTEPEYSLVSFLRLNDLKTELASCTLAGTVLPFRDDMTSEDACSVLCTILKKLREPQARASTVELLWQVQSDLSSRGFSLEFLRERENAVFGCSGKFEEDVELLICQLYWAIKKEERWRGNDAARVGMLSPIISPIMYREYPEIDIRKFIPTEYLILMIIGQLQFEYDLEGELLYREADLAVGNLLWERTLQDHCVLSILDAVNGDARKVWGLSELPEPLKQLFPVPFQELHKKLKAEEQSPLDAPEQENEL